MTLNNSDKKSRLRDAKKRIAIVQEILLKRWDPIGVCGEPEAVDEYDAYAPHIVSMVMQGCSPEQLSAHVSRIRVEDMGLRADPDRDRRIASEIWNALRT